MVSVSLTKKLARLLGAGQLRENLLPTVELLTLQQTDQVGDGFIADYLSLNWLECKSGALRLTVTGHKACDQVRTSPE